MIVSGTKSQIGVALLVAVVALVSVLAVALTAHGRTGGAKRVRVMAVGPKGVIGKASLLRAKGFSARVGSQRCRVAANTPFAALHAASRRSGFSYKARDYGSCSAVSAASSSQLFVYKVSRFRNRGSDGWFYKVNDRAGTTGAADMSGPFGNGRLRSGDRVAWFYCRHNRRTGSCQRTLRLIAPRRARKGRPLRVRVVGYDNFKRGRPLARVRVRLGGQVALTRKGGRAAIRPRRRGSLRLSAGRRGMVPAFPLRVRVR